MDAKAVTRWALPIGIAVVATAFAVARSTRTPSVAPDGGAATTSSAAPSATPSAPTCDAIHGSPLAPAVYRTPLPDDPTLAAWTARYESAFDDLVRLHELASRDGTAAGPDDATVVCLKKLLVEVDRELPDGSLLRDDAHRGVQRRWPAADPKPDPSIAGRAPEVDAHPSTLEAWLRNRTTPARTRKPEIDGCRATDAFVKPFPQNARLERALLAHFTPCVEDNFNSIDGPLDAQERMLRLTAEVVPSRVALTLEFFATTPHARSVGTIWDQAPFGRIPTDRGPTGNALRVVGDIVRTRLDATSTRDLADAIRRARDGETRTNRRARWHALVAYVEAGAPDVDERKPQELATAIDRGGSSARWALGLLPNELEEHAPPVVPPLVDADLVRAVTRFAETATDSVDQSLVLDVLGRMAPGTAAKGVVRAVASPDDITSRAGLETFRRWTRVPSAPKIATWLSEADVATLRTALAPKTCTSHEALDVLARAGDRALDEDVATCLAGQTTFDTSLLQSLFVLCTTRRDVNWTRTALALENHADSNATGGYPKRVANGCRTGKD